MKSYFFSIGILCLVMLTCCKKDKDKPVPPEVKPDPTLTLTTAEIDTNNAVHIQGKIIAPAWLDNPVYGIVYSADSIPTVNAPGKTILGNVSDSVNIVYAIPGLPGGKNYTFRLFVKTAEKVWYSNTKQVVQPSFQIVPLGDSVISRNTIITIHYVETVITDQATKFEVYFGDKKVDSVNAVVDYSGHSINVLVPIDYKQGTPITIKRGLYSQTIVPDIRVLPGYWRKIAAPAGAVMENTAYFTLGNKGYVIGGYPYQSQLVPTNAVWEIDLTTLVWTKKNPFPETSIYGAACVTLNGKAYLFGGITGTTTNSNKVWQYDPAADSWQTISSMYNDIYGVGRMNLTTLAYNNKIYLGAGVQLNGSVSSLYWFTTKWQTFDPVTLTWENLPLLPTTNRMQGFTNYINDNKWYLFGGDNEDHEGKDNFVFNFSDNTWSTPNITRALPPRAGVSVINKSNNTYFFGGYQFGPTKSRWMVSPEFWKMDADQQFTQFASASTTEIVNVLNRNAPIFATANGFIVYNELIWNGNNELARSVIEYVAD